MFQSYITSPSIGCRYNYISIHAVFLQGKIKLASTSAFVGARHNPEPTPLTLQDREKFKKIQI